MSPKTLSSKPTVAASKVGSSKPLIDVHDLKVPRRNKVLPVIIAVLTLLLAMMVVVRLNRTPEASILEDSATSNSTTTVTNATSEIPTFSVTVNGQEVALEPQTKATLTLSGQPLSKINASQISNVTRQGSTWLVTFIDGSQSMLNESMMKQLPGEVHFQAGYRRDR